MIPTNYCRFTGCRHAQLETIEEIDMGLCGRHSEEFNNSACVTLSCWSCGALIDTFHKEDLLEGITIEDDYLFSKKCPSCDKAVEFSNLQFVTINNEVDKELSHAVRDDGQIVVNDKEVV